MRISDWSSDVCSSDLWPPISATIRRARASTSICIELLPSTVSLHWDLYTFHGGGQTAGIYANIAHGPTRAIQYKYLRRLSSLEIGRASCRERVCKKEEISV